MGEANLFPEEGEGGATAATPFVCPGIGTDQNVYRIIIDFNLVNLIN